MDNKQINNLDIILGLYIAAIWVPIAVRKSSEECNLREKCLFDLTVQGAQCVHPAEEAKADR